MDATRVSGNVSRTDRVVVLSQDISDVLTESNIAADRITTIPNWVDTRKVHPVKSANAFRQELGCDGKFIVMYSGNLGLCQGLENVLHAAERLKAQLHIEFVLVGDGASRAHLAKIAQDRELTNVRFVDYQPVSRLSESLSAADLHLVPIDARVSRYLMPSKLYGVLASGTPVLSVAPEESELARLVEEHQVGFNVAPDDPLALSQKIQWCADSRNELNNYGQRARAGPKPIRSFRQRQSFPRTVVRNLRTAKALMKNFMLLLLSPLPHSHRKKALPFRQDTAAMTLGERVG